MKLKDVFEGYAIILAKNLRKFGTNCFVERFINDEDDAIYNAQSLTRCDGILYYAYDCKARKIIF